MSATGIGAAVRRKEDFRFITGQGQYTDDVVRPGETRAAFVRSPHARAKIKSVDAGAAKKVADDFFKNFAATVLAGEGPITSV